MFDEVTVKCIGGSGGSGAVSFLREKFKPKGPPDGGDGGNGGSVIFRGDSHETTLRDISHRQIIPAESGGNGRGSNQHGVSKSDLIISVPLGTLVEKIVGGGGDSLLADITQEDQEVIVAQGGLGGRGNARFKSSRNRSPRESQPGEEGELAIIKLTLKIIADVGLVGMPNSGKSSLLNALTGSHSRVADYPFTTLIPHLGVLPCIGKQQITIADIPGLIEGASTGHGLGDLFLRHIERTSLLVYIIDVAVNDPISDFDIVKNELLSYSQVLGNREYVICLNKADLLTIGDQRKLIKKFNAKNGSVFMISALTGEGLDSLITFLCEFIAENKKKASEKLSKVKPITTLTLSDLKNKRMVIK